jgi:hypothetical protein
MSTLHDPPPPPTSSPSVRQKLVTAQLLETVLALRPKVIDDIDAFAPWLAAELRDVQAAFAKEPK